MTNSVNDRNDALMERARRVIPGGVNSPVRAFRAVGGTPRFIQRAQGAYLWDANDQRYIDYIGSWGPMILGHGHPAVLEAVRRAAQDGLSFGAPTEREVELAEEILSLMPSMDMVRLVSSGTEAGMSAIRLARGATGRSKIIKFEGCYHGHSDSLLVKAGSGLLTFGNPSSAGVPADFTKAFGDFSEQGIAQGVKATVEGALAKVFDWQRQQEQRQLQEQQARQQQAASAHMQAIYGAHPDADTVAESREFQAWVDAQPVYARAGIAQALQAGSAQDVVAVLDAFKQAGRPAAAPAAKAAPQPAAAKADVQAAAAPPVSLSALPGSAPAVPDAERVAQLAASDPVALMDFMSKLTSDQRERLMNSLV